LALVAAAASGSPKFFAGTDSAPHVKDTKESGCGCAGCYTSHAAVELYTEALAKAGALKHLDAFMSKNGARFYGLPANQGASTKLVKKEWTVPSTYAPHLLTELHKAQQALTNVPLSGTSSVTRWWCPCAPGRRWSGPSRCPRSFD
jgi:dihydroorotase